MQGEAILLKRTSFCSSFPSLHTEACTGGSVVWHKGMFSFFTFKLLFLKSSMGYFLVIFFTPIPTIVQR